MKTVTNSAQIIQKVFFMLLTLSAALPMYAQQRPPEILQGAEAQKVVPLSEMVRMNPETQTPSFIKFQEANAPAFRDFNSMIQKTFRVGDDYQMVLLRSDRDQLGYEHYRYQQTYQGLPVEGAVFIAHVKDGKVMSINGLFADKIDVVTQPSLSEEACFSKALASIHADKYMWELLEEQPQLREHDAYKDFGEKPKGELAILDKNLGTGLAPEYHLVYKFNIYAYEPHQRVDIFMDAKTGEAVRQFSKIHEDDLVGDEVGTAETTYSGNRSMTADNTGVGATPYRLFESGRNISTKNLTGNAEYTDNDNAWTAAEMGTNKYAMDCHWATEKTHEYYLTKFNRNSFDGNGALIQSYLNNNQAGAVNAFWNGISLNYGSGYNSITPLTTLDVVGHEFTHALTQYTAGLIYSYESGALNESFSDIFGVAIEFYAKPPYSVGNWTLGEEAGIIIRSMANPNAYYHPDTYLGAYWYTGPWDNGGVHTNSGVQNFWFYLLTTGGTGTNDHGAPYNVTGIGIDDAAAIAYRSLTVYLTPSSNYADARFYSIIAAKDLFGGCSVSQQVVSTTDAWQAVGVGPAYTPQALVMDIFTTNDTFFCSLPQSIHFNALQLAGVANPATVSWNFGDGGTGTGLSPTHVYNTAGSFTVTLNASDCSGTPIAPIVKTNFIVIDNTNPCTLNMSTSGSHSETTCTGTLYDNGGADSNYIANTTSTFTIHSPSSEKVTLKFNYFYYELNYDYLKIYDGPSTASPLIGSYTGYSVPNGGTIQSTGTSITIQQLIDPFIEEAGFELTWTSEMDGDGVPSVNCGGTDCDDNDPNVWVSCGSCVDADMDGYYSGCDAYTTVPGPDCDDTNPAIHPGAAEVCDGVDNNCAFGIDENFDCLFPGNLVYVKKDATGAGDGSSWADAFNDLHFALTLAQFKPIITEIWVAAGTYYPDEGAASTPDDRNASFVLKSGVAVYGGFNGTETNREQRNPAVNLTILSGDLKQDDTQQPVATNAATNANTFENSYTVVNGSNTDSTAVLDGFTITAGNANGNGLFPNPNARGGGMFINAGAPVITHCTFSGNAAPNIGGGGLYTCNSAAPVLSSCTFTGNAAPGVSENTGSGAGIFNTSSSVIHVSDCTFSENTARIGAAIYNHNSPCTAILSNCIISNNITSSSAGGGICSWGSLNIDNCEIFNNQSKNWGGGVFQGNGAMVMTNTSVRDNEATELNGGGLWIQDCNQATMTNCEVLGNVSLFYGSGIFSYSSNLSLVNCTVAYNSSGNSYSAIRKSEGGTLTLTNTIVANNNTYNFSGAPFLSDGNNLDDDGTSGFINGVNGDITMVDPLFVSSTDLHLQVGSPAIDAGKSGPNIPAVDLEGNPRPIGEAYDMGAFEAGSPCPSGTILYVNKNATGTNVGTSWAQAYTHLQDALSSACPGITEIWVAAGTYYPDQGTGYTDNDRSHAFVMKDSVAIYGGFAGNETQRSARNWTDNVTILSGDIDQVPGNAGNSFHVVNNDNNGLDSTAILDGFTITGGNTSYTNVGGGMNNVASSPTVANCIFIDNTAGSGGGMANSESSPLLVNCSFIGNSAIYGGGLGNNDFSSPTLINCTFLGNTASDTGGGMDSYFYSSPTVTNCTFSGNAAINAGGSMLTYSNALPAVVTNCIFWGNSSEPADNGSATVTYSIVEGGFSGTGNLNLDPLFVTQPPIGLGTTGNLHLQAASPAIDAATSGANIPGEDLDGKPRPLGAGYDMGAYESGTPCSANNIIYVNKNATGKNYGTSWTHAFNNLQDALNVACPDVTEIWVAAGTYYPDEGSGYINNDRNASFVMKDSVAIYGGFHGDETSLGQRNWVANVTTLSGDIDNVAGNTGNSFHVVNNNNNGLDSAAILDGFFISGGNGELGGGMHNISVSPTVTNCVFLGNTAFYYGGGMYNNNSSPTVTNCAFAGNSAQSGGGMENDNHSDPVITNCSFGGNSANAGAAIENYDYSSPTVTNCILWGSSSEIVEGYFAAGTVTYSIVQGGFPGTGNLDQDPLFINPAAGDLHINSCSPARDAGTTAGASATDYDGENRPLGIGIDMGFDENDAPCCPPAGILFVKANATGRNDGSNWANAFTNLQDALNSPCPGITEIWVAAGTYKPAICTTCTPGDRAIAFVMKEGVNLRGGFPNTGNPGLGDVDPQANVTILSGDIGMVGDISDNSYHIIKNDNNGLTSNTVLFGFTITGGNTNGAGWPNNNGGGIFNYLVSLTIDSCTFQQNYASYAGGAMYNAYGNFIMTGCHFNNNVATYGGAIITHSNAGYPDVNHTLSGCSFIGNNAHEVGGAVVHGFINSDGSGLFDCTNCTFINNTAFNEDTLGRGGAFQNSSIGFDSKFTNCLFDGNQCLGTTDWGGGALLVNEGNCTVVNSNFVNNVSAAEGGAIGIHSANGTVEVKNTIFWDNTAPVGNSISNTQGGVANASHTLLDDNACPANVTCDTGMVFNQAPLFENPANNDWHLQPGSPAIDAGTGGANVPNVDFEGNPRPNGLSFDLGIFEYTPCAPSNILYVNKNAAGLNNGNTWADAFTNLQDALNSPCISIVEIWVAAGTYYPDEGIGYTNNDQNASFVMKNNLGIYGGFAGNETYLEERNPWNNVTILSGDIDQVAGNDGNSFHVVNNDNNGLDTTAILDGFTITGGNTSYTNVGGGMNNNISSPKVANCIFIDNTAGNGGGMNNYGSSPVLINCAFIGNSAIFGGGLSNGDYSSPTLTNCTFSGNTASQTGGGMDNYYYSSPTVTNCTFFGNTADVEGGSMSMYGAAVPAIVTNSIFWNNSPEVLDNGSITMTYSIVEGGFSGTGNLNEDPLFASPTDLRPGPCSPALDMGTNAANTTLIDLAGNPRKMDATGSGTATIDMGAYELQSNITLPVTWTGLGDGILWSDPANWSDGFVPQPCRDVVIPSGTVTIPAGFDAVGKTLEVMPGALLDVAPTATLDINN